MVISQVCLSIDRESGSIEVPGSGTKTIIATFEDVRLALNEDTFALVVREIIDTLYEKSDWVPTETE